MSYYQSFNTSSAYKLDDFAPSGSNKTQKQPIRRKKVNKKAVMVRKIKKAAMTACLLALAFMIVRGYVSIDEMNGSISSLKTDYNKIIAENQAISAEIDKSLDLSELQSIAKEKYGLVRPEKYQVFYIDMSEGDDGQLLASADKEKKTPSLTGASGILADSMNVFD